MLLTFTVPEEHPALAGHFPGMPVVPAALLLDEVAHRFTQATGLKVNTVKQVRFTAPLAPGQQLDVQYQPKNSAEYRFVGSEKGNPVVKGALDYTVTKGKYVPLMAASEAPASIRDCYRQLPHAGTMCLLEQVLYHDAEGLACLAPVPAVHPLYRERQLPAWASLEYAAQALACHGILQLPSPSPDGAGFREAMLIGVRNMICYAEAIAAEQPLRIEVQLTARQPGAASCTFCVSQQEQLISAGQFNVLYRTRAGTY